jgi:uncharacterized protein YjiS (DUF1127 family)
MRNLAPPRQLFERMKGHITVRAQLPELSDWSLKDIGIFRQVPGLDAVKPFWMA